MSQVAQRISGWASALQTLPGGSTSWGIRWALPPSVLAAGRGGRAPRAPLGPALQAAPWTGLGAPGCKTLVPNPGSGATSQCCNSPGQGPACAAGRVAVGCPAEGLPGGFFSQPRSHHIPPCLPLPPGVPARSPGHPRPLPAAVQAVPSCCFCLQCPGKPLCFSCGQLLLRPCALPGLWAMASVAPGPSLQEGASLLLP